jgi:hypothetical protein
MQLYAVPDPDFIKMFENISSWVRRIWNFFFICFKANLSKYGSYLLHIRMFRYIR